MGQAPASQGVGIQLPERRSDFTGKRPSWYPFQISQEGEDTDSPDFDPLPTDRHRTIPPAPPPPDWQY